MNNFQTILTAIFLAIFVFAVLIFSGMIKIGDSFNSGGSEGLDGKIIIWGTLSAPDFYKVFEEATGGNRNLYINYVKKSTLTYQQDLIEAFAKSKGPDLFFITPDMIIENEDFFYEIPYESYPEKVFRDTFIDGADIYLNEKGIIAFPIVVDPMVMYYNKNIFKNEALANPPTAWNELYGLASKLTKKENSGIVNQGLIALGRYDNVTNSKEILSTLLLQNGNSIIKRSGEVYVSVFNKSTFGSSKNVTQTVLDYLVEFSNPSNVAYSWNRSLPKSFEMFTTGKLAIYLGKASELFTIEKTNPNLSFDVAEILQTKGTNKVTFGDIYAIAVNKKSTNTTLSFSVIGLLSSNDSIKNFSEALSLPPTTKSLLSKKAIDPYMYTFYNSAIFSKSWADPNPVASNAIFTEMFENILSNKMDTEDAISRANGQLSQLIK